MTAVQGPYFEAVGAIEGLARARIVPRGYELNFRKGSLFVCVCPWHWRSYSHYQFWEVLAAAHLAKLRGIRHALLATNAEWTDWCWDGFESVFDRVLVGEPAQVAAEVARAVDEAPTDGKSVPVPSPGRVFFGQVRPGTSTVTLKEQMAHGLKASGERVPARVSIRPTYGGHRPVTFVLKLGNGLVLAAKGFRNPDPIHEVKILAGKAFAVGPTRAREILYVVDGKIREEDLEPILVAGASVTTPDRFREAVRELGRVT